MIVTEVVSHGAQRKPSSNINQVGCNLSILTTFEYNILCIKIFADFKILKLVLNGAQRRVRCNFYYFTFLF